MCDFPKGTYSLLLHPSLLCPRLTLKSIEEIDQHGKTAHLLTNIVNASSWQKSYALKKRTRSLIIF